MSKHEKGSIGDHSSKTMLKEIDDQLETLAGLIVSFLHTVDEAVSYTHLTLPTKRIV